MTKVTSKNTEKQQLTSSPTNTSEASLLNPEVLVKTPISVLPISEQIYDPNPVSQFEILEMPPIEVFYCLKQ